MKVSFTPPSVGEYELTLSVPQKYSELVCLSNPTMTVRVQKRVTDVENEISELKQVLKYHDIKIDEGLYILTCL